MSAMQLLNGVSALSVLDSTYAYMYTPHHHLARYSDGVPVPVPECTKV